MDADYYLETIRVVFQDFALVSGTWDVRSEKGKIERVKPSDITTTALLSVEGELDDISGSGQTRAVHDICSGVPKSLQKHYEAMGAGHYGIFSGRRWREMVYPQVKAFIKSHDKPTSAPKAVTVTAAPPAAVSETKVPPAPAKTARAATKKVASKQVSTAK